MYMHIILKQQQQSQNNKDYFHLSEEASHGHPFFGMGLSPSQAHAVQIGYTTKAQSAV